MDWLEIAGWTAPIIITALGTVILYWIIAKTFAQQPNNRLYRQFAQLVLVLLALVLAGSGVVSLPLPVPWRRGGMAVRRC